MTDTEKTILGICILVIVYILARKITLWRIKRTYIAIAKDLESRGAFDPDSAVDLSYARKGALRFGMRDFRSEALKYLVVNEVVGVTDEGKYYLKNRKIASLNE